jgi:hypothetical protein
LMTMPQVASQSVQVAKWVDSAVELVGWL